MFVEYRVDKEVKVEGHIDLPHKIPPILSYTVQGDKVYLSNDQEFLVFSLEEKKVV